MKVYQGKNYYVWRMNINGMIRYGVSKKLCVGTILVTKSYSKAVDFCKEIDE